MAGDLEAVTRQMLDALDRSDADGMIRTGAEDIQGVDEISRRWMRGMGEVGGYIRELTGMVQDVHSTIRDVHETTWGDAGILTCWLDQDYVLDGADQHISAPSTLVFRRVGGAWKIVLFHSIPLPPETT